VPSGAAGHFFDMCSPRRLWPGHGGVRLSNLKTFKP
jgi:hypothetical protein